MTPEMRRDLLEAMRARTQQCPAGKIGIEAAPAFARGVFEDVHRCYCDLVDNPHYSQPVLERSSVRRPFFSRPKEEFTADFTLLARRTLDRDDWRIFRAFHMLRADSRAIARREGMTEEQLTLAVERIESQVGRACMITTPYPLWPIEQYFEPGRKGAAA